MGHIQLYNGITRDFVCQPLFEHFPWGLSGTPCYREECPECKAEREEAKRVIEDRLRKDREEKDRLIKDVEEWLGKQE